MSDMNFRSTIALSYEDSRNSVKNCDGETSALPNSHYFQKLKFITKNVLNILGSILIISYLLSTPHCMLREEIGRSHLISALLAGAGLCYVLLETVTDKLIINGGSRVGYILCILNLLDQEQQKCPGAGDIFAMGTHNRTQEWQYRLQVVQGAVIVACIIQMLIGSVGIRRLAKYIRPVTIAPTMLLISISVIRTTAIRMAHTCWILFFVTVSFMLLFYSIHHYYFGVQDSSCNKVLNIRHNLHIGVISALVIWVLCIVLSSMEYIEDGSSARTDTYAGALNHVSPVRLSYSFQWGQPRWEMDAIMLVLPACFISVFEVLAFYYSYDHLESEQEWDEEKMENRKKATWCSIIRWEAAFCLLNVTMGTALGIAIGFKKQNQDYAGFIIGVILVLIALSGKLCSLFVMIPESIVSALIFFCFMSMFFEGLNVMQCIDFRSVKSLYIFGSSIFLGFVIPALVKGEYLFITENKTLHYPLLSLLSIDFVVAGFVAVSLDNLLRVLAPEKFVLPINIKVPPNDQKVEQNSESINFCDCFVPFFV